jgi:pimeloyl-ACP methyl ester carboxylesterase
MGVPGFEETAQVAVSGAELAYRELGQGEPLVLVHGGASDLRTWERQLPVFAESHRTIAYSRRFARPNARIDPDADDPIDTHVADQVAVLEALGASPAHLVGHSWGGFVSLLTASRHPEHVRTLVLIEPPVLTLLSSVPPRPKQLARLFVRRPRAAAAIVRFGAGAAAPAERAFRRGDDEQALTAFGRGVLGRDAFARLSPERLQQARDNIDVDRAQLLGAGFPPVADDEVRRVLAPTLLLCGSKSPAFLRHVADRLEALLPDVERVTIPGASHLVHEDQPAAANAAIVDFLRRRAR